MTLNWILPGIFLCMLGSAFFSGMETGLISINYLRLQHLLRRRARGAAAIKRMLEKPDLLISTTLVGNNICNVLCSVLAVRWATARWDVWGARASPLVMTLLLLVCSEYLPKAWFRGRPAVRVLPFVGLLSLWEILFRPINRLVNAIVRLMLPAHRTPPFQLRALVTREDLRHLTHEGERSGYLSAPERRLIHGVFDLAHRTCGDIMIPRDELVTVTPEMTAEQVTELARSQSLSRLPVWQPATRTFVGFIHVLDLLGAGEPTAQVRDFMRPPQFVAATEPLDNLLPRLRLTQQPLAFVQDDKEQVIGLVTLDRLLDKWLASATIAPAPPAAVPVHG
ncbi:MAG: CNNM domain-containing protein [Candidatus Marinimicrobia bacterium]|nr:CNNM domain-containing protein [Candidatus Neomarinimicrobiota bacterium]